MFRFTIRDVLWLTVVVAFAVLWQMEIRERYREHSRDLRSELVDTRLELARAQSTVRFQQDRLDVIDKTGAASALVAEIASLKEQIKMQKMLTEFYKQRATDRREVSAAPLGEILH